MPNTISTQYRRPMPPTLAKLTGMTFGLILFAAGSVGIGLVFILVTWLMGLTTISFS